MGRLKENGKFHVIYTSDQKKWNNNGIENYLTKSKYLKLNWAFVMQNWAFMSEKIIRNISPATFFRCDINHEWVRSSWKFV